MGPPYQQHETLIEPTTAESLKKSQRKRKRLSMDPPPAPTPHFYPPQRLSSVQTGGPNNAVSTSLTAPARASRHYPNHSGTGLEVQLLPPPSHDQHSSRTIRPLNHRPAEATTAAVPATTATIKPPQEKEKGRQKANRTASAAHFNGFYINQTNKTDCSLGSPMKP